MLFKVGSVTPADESYAQYSLCADDLIVNADGKGIYLTTDLIYALKGKSEGDTVEMKVLRGGEKITVEVKLRWDCAYESHRFGFFETLGRSFMYSFKIAGTIFRVLGELLTGHLGISSMGGPVTTIKLTSEVAAQSFQSFLEIATYIGVNLAVFNLLPIPALDGSKVIFCLIEWIFRKPVPRKVEAVIHAVGFFLILGFAVLVDILQFI